MRMTAPMILPATMESAVRTTPAAVATGHARGRDIVKVICQYLIFDRCKD